MYEETLQKAGLTEKQAKTYLACLNLGQAKAPEIAKAARIKRTTTYGILDELINLGVLSYSQKGRSKIYKAQSPEVFVNLLESRKRELQSIIPEIEQTLATHFLKPKIEFFEGKQGIKRIYEDTLNCRSKKLLQVVRVKDFVKFPGKEFSKEYIKKRAEQNIIAYALHPKSDDTYDDTYGQNSKKWKRKVKYLPPNMFHASMIMIYDDKAAMISTKKENFGFIIQSKEFTKTLEAYFNFMWKMGSKNPEIAN